jgi:D-galactonate transporter
LYDWEVNLAPPLSLEAQFEAATYRKIAWRLMPFLLLCYILAYVDRVNVGFAKLQMQRELGMSDAVYGAGAGIFFIGYFLFEVPSNIILQRIGARYWIGPIMIVWGALSAATMFVTGPVSFYVLRFFLGIVESGFFPGVILYLTFWFTNKYRAKMVAMFMTGIPLSGALTGPISGWILARMSGVGHLHAWQWLFLVEGIPSLLAGLLTLAYLTDNPAKAAWLDHRERRLVLDNLHVEEEMKKRTSPGNHKLSDAFRSVDVWILAFIYFAYVMGNYGLGFWLPQVIHDTLTINPLFIGWISVIPWGAAAIGMVLAGHHSDVTGERRWHLTLAGVLGAAAFAVSSLPGISGTAGLAALTIAAIGTECALCLFWTLPTGILSGAAAAAGIAWINSIGNLSGYASPYLIGTIKDRTHSMTLALLALSVCQLIGSALTLYVTRNRATRRAR